MPSRSVRIYTIPRRDRLRRFATTRARLAFYPSAKLDILWPLLRREGHACVASAHCDGVGWRNDGLWSRSGAQGRCRSARSSWPERRSWSARPPFGIRIVRSNCDATNCSVQCGDDEMLLTAYCGVRRNAAVIPTERSATCRSPVPANSPLVAACVKMPPQ